jgi:hypothetical protein
MNISRVLWLWLGVCEDTLKLDPTLTSGLKATNTPKLSFGTAIVFNGLFRCDCLSIP